MATPTPTTRPPTHNGAPRVTRVPMLSFDHSTFPTTAGQPSPFRSHRDVDSACSVGYNTTRSGCGTPSYGLMSDRSQRSPATNTGMDTFRSARCDSARSWAGASFTSPRDAIEPNTYELPANNGTPTAMPFSRYSTPRGQSTVVSPREYFTHDPYDTAEASSVIAPHALELFVGNVPKLPTVGTMLHQIIRQVLIVHHDTDDDGINVIVKSEGRFVKIVFEELWKLDLVMESLHDHVQFRPNGLVDMQWEGMDGPVSSMGYQWTTSEWEAERCCPKHPIQLERMKAPTYDRREQKAPNSARRHQQTPRSGRRASVQAW